jgi:undecaprenyl-diphosphatase
MSDRELFELINAAAGAHAGWLLLAQVFAVHATWMALLSLLVAWFGGDDVTRRAVARLVTGMLLAVSMALLFGILWPQPRPFDLELGHQHLDPTRDASFPSVHVTLLWSLGLGALLLRPRRTLVGGGLLLLGLVVGWSRIYLGVQFPTDVLGALPVSALGAGVVWGLRRQIEWHFTQPLIVRYHRWAERWRAWWITHRS